MPSQPPGNSNARESAYLLVGEHDLQLTENLGVAIIDREMAEQVVFEIINGVQPDKVDPDGVMEVFEVYTETEITCIC